MSATHRIRTIYGKELVDILRDHRTLIAMIVVPIVLYPLLMLGSIQAVSYQSDRIAEEELRVGVLNQAQGQSLLRVINTDAAALDRERDDAKEDPLAVEDAIDPEKIKLLVLDSLEAIEQAVRERTIHIGVTFDRDTLVDALDFQNQVRLIIDKEDIRSASARGRLSALFHRTAERACTDRKTQAGLPPAFDQPFKIDVVDLSSPPSILGQVLPLILVLMTITGAIYPAIDLTAGERERGTLESLMVCPVPVIDLIVGKFLVVTTVAIIGAALNLSSVTLTVYFGGFGRMIAQSGGSIPFAKMAFILLCLIPFAVLMSAIMLAVCSFARTFKEAQNYVTPVILAVLIPAGLAAMPATRLEGVMLVMPVGNMVLLARDILLGAVVPPLSVTMVLLSTTLYAAASVAVAANVFGQEVVIFSDAGSWKSLLSRRFLRPTSVPSISLGLLVTALLFPLWFFIQSALSPQQGEDAVALLYGSAWLMPAFFVLLPLAVTVYAKIGLVGTFALRVPSLRHVIAAVIIGLSAWVPVHELNILQFRIVGAPEALLKSAETLEEALRSLHPAAVFLVIAVVPAMCEELLFRGFLLSSLLRAGRVVPALITSAAIFAVFHFILFKFAVTAALGLILAYMCYRSRSILPGMIAHALHNALGALEVVYPAWRSWIGLVPSSDPSTDTLHASDPWAHLPIPIVAVGTFCLIIGLRLMRRTPAPAA